MILYLDASALVKRYVAEQGSEQVNTWIEGAAAIATSLLSRAEVAAAIARAVRLKWLGSEEGQRALELFYSEWESLQRLPVTESMIIRAGALAVEHNLRGYDAVHLSSALLWQDALDFPVSVATFDRELSRAASKENAAVLP